MSHRHSPDQDPHAHSPLVTAGTPIDSAEAALIMVHGRGATAASILDLVASIRAPGRWAYLAPQAAGNTWYPNSFLAPLESNEPYLSSALHALEEAVARVAAAGIPLDRTVLLGFSQGACLAVEFAARHARRYGGILVLSGGLIGPPGTERVYAGSLAGTPVFLGCSDTDFHIPAARVLETAEILEQLGGQVTARLYPGLGHTVNADEIAHVAAVMRAVTAPPA